MTAVTTATDPLQRHAELQAALNQRLGVLHLMPESDPAYAAACDEVLAAGLALADLEDHLPELLEAVPHRTTRALLIGCTAVALLSGAAVTLFALYGIVSRWWLPAAVAALFGAVELLRTRVLPPQGPHRRQRPPAVAVAAAALLLFLAALLGAGGQGTWLLVLAAAVLGAVGLVALRSAPHRAPREGR
jgi:peptidoglycan/LPS O-acetylase OafA/YrhL